MHSLKRKGAWDAKSGLRVSKEAEGFAIASSSEQMHALLLKHMSDHTRIYRQATCKIQVGTLHRWWLRSSGSRPRV